MHSSLFKLSMLLSAIIGIFSLLLKGDFTFRSFGFLITVLLFLINTYLYSSKVGIFSVSYIIYFILLFISNNVSPFLLSYNDNELHTGRVNDYYILYFISFFVISIFILFYLLLIKRKTIVDIIFKINTSEAWKIFIIALFISPLWLLGGEDMKLILIPAVIYFFVFIFSKPECIKKNIFKIGGMSSLAVISVASIHRFIFITYIFPLIIFFILNRKKRMSFSKLLKYCFLFLIFFSVYGIVSELYKLNAWYGGSYSINDFIAIISDFDLLFQWVDRQFYRIFDIWTHLSGEIINYVNIHGYFYGLTYVKSLAGIFNFPYVDLAKIVANIIGANYAQPGLMADGYANFGIFGVIINYSLAFFGAEYFMCLYLRKGTMLTLLLYLIPFTKLILDGGTIFSILHMIIIVFIGTLPWINIKKRYRNCVHLPLEVN